VRGGISGQYEDVRLPPMEWENAARDAGLRWRPNYSGGRSVRHKRSGGESGEDKEERQDEDWEIGLMDVGESLVV
jgi:hypothetical protein